MLESDTSKNSQVPFGFQDPAFNPVISFIKKHLLLLIFLILVITFFTRNNFKNVQDIAPEILGQPHQEKIENASVIHFKKNGYVYEITPLYDFEISALIVSKTNYKLFSMEKFDRVFPYDVCLIWGTNVSSGLYKNRTLRFSQDCRWCFAQWYGDVAFNWEEFSNSHLLINNSQIERKVKLLSIGDQVTIIGKLVNVKAHLVGKSGSFDSSDYAWNSGVGKSGLGAGACKVIYVEDVEILKEANVLSRFLFQVSLYGLFALIGWKALCFLGILKIRN